MAASRTKLNATISFWAPKRVTFWPSHELFKTEEALLVARVSSCVILSSPLLAQTADSALSPVDTTLDGPVDLVGGAAGGTVEGGVDCIGAATVVTVDDPVDFDGAEEEGILSIGTLIPEGRLAAICSFKGSSEATEVGIVAGCDSTTGLAGLLPVSSRNWLPFAPVSRLTFLVEEMIGASIVIASSSVCGGFTTMTTGACEGSTVEDIFACAAGLEVEAVGALKVVREPE